MKATRTRTDPLHYGIADEGQASEIVALFQSVFSDAEGAEEGALIARLVDDLFLTCTDEDRFVFVAREEEATVACIIFTRLGFFDDPRTVFLMSPVAVMTGHQGRGIGQRLISEGLKFLRDAGVDAVVTYGDPGFYGRCGFSFTAGEKVPAPIPLSQPHGWLAQSLSDRPLTEFKGRSTCADAFRDPALW